MKYREQSYRIPASKYRAFNIKSYKLDIKLFDANINYNLVHIKRVNRMSI